MENTLRQVLVLNKSYIAIGIITARRAMTLIAKGAAVVLEPSKHVIHTSVACFPLPSVIRLERTKYVPHYNRAVSRKSILMRDGHTCQYCRTKLAPQKLTLDHVIPRSRRGANTWENLVTCCHACNNRKADRTPEEAGMSLAMKPRPFSMHARHKQAANTEPAWEKYLFY